MGIHPPDQVTAPTTPVHWTRFPAASLNTVDWTNHEQAHHAVMRLFPATLPGPPHRRRADSGILYRLDNVMGQAVVLIQSHTAPELLPADAKTMAIPAPAWNFDPGQLIAFRAAINPTIRRGIRTTLDGKPYTKEAKAAELPFTRTTKVVGITALDDIPTWLTARLNGAVDTLEIANHFRDHTTAGNTKIVIDTLDCTATVTNPTTLDHIRRTGIGRAKAYGCGLLTAQPAY